MENDEREVDWALRRIKQLEKDLVESAKAIDQVSEELSGTDKAMITLNDRISRLERTTGLGDLEDEELDTSLIEWIVQLVQRQTGLAGKIEWIQESGAEAQNEIELRITSIESQYPGFEDLISRVVRLEKQTEFEASEANARIKAFEAAMALKLKMDNRSLERITALENGSRLVGTGNLIAEIMNRLDALEGHPRRSGSERNPGPIGCFPPVEDEFSPPVGGNSIVEMDARDERKSYDRGLVGTLAAQTSLELAETRVRQYMSGHFSAASIDGVVQAMWGRQGWNGTALGVASVPVRDNPQA